MFQVSFIRVLHVSKVWNTFQFFILKIFRRDSKKFQTEFQEKSFSQNSYEVSNFWTSFKRKKKDETKWSRIWRRVQAQLLWGRRGSVAQLDSGPLKLARCRHQCLMTTQPRRAPPRSLPLPLRRQESLRAVAESCGAIVAEHRYVSHFHHQESMGLEVKMDSIRVDTAPLES